MDGCMDGEGVTAF